MRAAWWWIDRWRKSTAYIEMTAEEQGLYRNLLDAVWLFDDGIIPDNQRCLVVASGGDPEAWARSGEKVLRWMQRKGRGWTNTTALGVKTETQRIHKVKSAAGSKGGKQRVANAQAKAEAKAEAERQANAQANSNPPSPSPSLTYIGTRKHDRDDHGPPTIPPANVPSNPFIPLGGRPALEGEVLELVLRLSKLTGKDPVEIMACSASYEGDRGRTKLNPANMTDDRLLHTLRDLRADVAAAEAKHGT